MYGKHNHTHLNRFNLGTQLQTRYHDNLNLGAHAENERGRGYTGRRVEEEEGSGKERVMEGRTGRRAAGGWRAGGRLAEGEARRGETR